MCEFCVKHGDGKKWYLEAKNYSEDMISDLRRRRFVTNMYTHPEHLKEAADNMEKLRTAPSFVKRMVGRRVSRQFKRIHFGQVLPLEDIREVFHFCNSIVRIACVCRHATLGKDVGYCYAVSLGPHGGEMCNLLRGLDDSFMNGPDALGYEELDRSEALAALQEHEKEGLLHSVWTFGTPFIGGICNCDRSDCLAMRTTITHGIKLMFRGEYVAETNVDQCNGCRSCMRVCQFGAISYGAATKKAHIDPGMCYGCGICRTMCSTNAISLKPRAEVPAAAGLW